MTVRLANVHPVLMVRDVAASIRFYAQLGFQLAFHDADPPMYAGIRRDDVELHLQWHDSAAWTCPQGHDRPTYRFVVDDVDGLFAELVARGVSLDPAKLGDTPWGTREFHLYDPDRNGLQFYRDL